MPVRKQKQAIEGVQIIKAPNGDELVVLPRARFEELLARTVPAGLERAGGRVAAFTSGEVTPTAEDIEAREVAEAIEAVRTGKLETITAAELRELLAAPTPLAFWRKKRALTQRALADRVGVSQAFIAEIEAGKKMGDVTLYKRLAEALRVKMESLVRN